MKKGHHFIGVSIPKDVKEELKNVQKTLKVNKYFNKVTGRDDFHITLLFLGAWENRKKVHLWNDLKERMQIVPPFRLTLNKIGIFGREDHPRVVWVSVDEEDALSNIQYTIKEGAAQYHFPFDKKPFRPHITLGKSFKNNGVPIISNIEVLKLTWEVNEIELFYIKPNENPMYESISKISLCM